MSKLDEILNKIADKAEAEGVEIDGNRGGPVHRFIQANVKYRPETEFYILMFLTIELANREARRQGFKDQYDRALSKIRNL